ncbi:M15 family metallopeptidase [Mesorhizobium sp. M0915]|uniref:M15 family metallopeptidase n=1 Tax=Mesorhizobium sp. M0915 TaxID=2957027 RepID=UPI00333B4F5C
MPKMIMVLLVSCISVAQSATAESTKTEPIPDEIWAKMQGHSWHSDLRCPGRNELVLVTVPYIDFSGQERTGYLIVSKALSNEVVDIFSELFEAKFRIEKMRLMDEYGGDDNASMNDNNTTAFNCRKKTSGRNLSAHSFGIAIDINPAQNPYVSKGQILPESSKFFAEPGNRTADRPGVIVKGGVVTAAFSRQGWKWGGGWTTLKDYQHFSKNGE